MSRTRFWVWCLVLLGLTLSSARASAQSAGANKGGSGAIKDLELRITITDRLGLRGEVDPKQGYKACRASSVAQPSQQVTGGLVADTSAGDYRAERFLRAALTGDAVQCTAQLADINPRGGWSSSGSWKTMTVTPPSGLSSLKGKVVSWTPLLPPRYSVRNGLPEVIVRALGETLPDCKVFDASPAIVNEKDRKDNCEVVPDGDSIRIKMPRTITSGRVDLDYKGGPTVSFPISSCSFVLAGPVRALVRDARKQKVFARQRDDAEVRCDPFLLELDQLKLGAHTIHLRVDRSWDDEGIALNLDRIPKDLPLGAQDIEVHGPDGMIGTLHTTVTVPIEAAETVRVVYDVKDDKGNPNNPNPYFKAATSDSTKVAVVNGGNVGQITNGVIVQVPSPIPRGSGVAGLVERLQGRERNEVIQNRQAQLASSFDERPVTSELVWRIAFSPLADIFVAGCAKDPTAPEPDKWRSPECTLTAPLDAVTFDVRKPTSAPVAPIFVLDRITVREGNEGCEAGSCKLEVEREPLLETAVPLASSARVESVPLPVREALVVQCGLSSLRPGREPETHDAAGHDVTRAVKNDALESGDCELRVVEEFGAYLALFGPQALVVTIQQQGGQKLEQGVVLSEKNKNFRLPQPQGERQDGKIYTVEVRLANKADTLDGAVKYRVGAPDPAFNGTAAVRGEYQFVAYLRPHGRFGTGNWCRSNFGVRTYVTGSLDLGGIRFPASARELKNSGEPTAFQLVAPRPGILFTLEPWNYHTGQNALASYGVPLLSPALQAGFQLTKVTDDEIGVSFLAGLSFNIPVIENAPSQLGTSVGLGLYYENDLRGGHYLLTTFGFKIGSLFSGSTK